MYRELTTAKVLTMSFESGVKITNVAKIEAAGIDPQQLSRTFLRVMIKQIIFDGYFHGDAHPGNILVNLQNGNIIFLDLGMPGMNGYTIAEQLKSDLRTARSILVALTGWGSAEDRRKTAEAGFSYHLTKPVDDGDVRGMLRRDQDDGRPIGRKLAGVVEQVAEELQHVLAIHRPGASRRYPGPAQHHQPARAQGAAEEGRGEEGRGASTHPRLQMDETTPPVRPPLLKAFPAALRSPAFKPRPFSTCRLPSFRA